MNEIPGTYTNYVNKRETMSEGFEKRGPGTDNKAFVSEDEIPPKSFDKTIDEGSERSDYTGYGFKEVV